MLVDSFRFVVRDMPTTTYCNCTVTPFVVVRVSRVRVSLVRAYVRLFCDCVCVCVYISVSVDAATCTTGGSSRESSPS